MTNYLPSMPPSKKQTIFTLGKTVLRAALFGLLVPICATNGLAAWNPDPVVPNGYGVQLKGECDSADDLDRVKELGVKWVRRGFLWNAVEPTKGTYTFTNFDRFVKDCQARGLRIVGVVALQNKNYGHPKDEPGRSAFVKYAAALAERYKDSDIVWEIWNEPNTMTFWGKHGAKGNSESYAEEYLSLVKAVVPAMKKANPKCIIMGGSVSNMWTKSYEWMEYSFNKGILKTGIDIWSVHPYGLKSPEDYIEAYAIMRKAMVAAGGPADFPVANTERGFPLMRDGEGYAGGDEAMATEYQAWHLVRQYLIDTLSNVTPTIWYEWAGKDDKKGFSLFKSGAPPTPAFNACKTLIEQLRGFHLDKRIDLSAPRDFALRYVNPAGGVRLVVWTAPPPHESPDKTINHSVKIPAEGATNMQVVDLFGKKSTVKASGGSVEIALTGSPQYLIVKE